MTTTPDPIAAIERALEGVKNQSAWSVEGYDDATGQVNVIGDGLYIAGVIANQPDQEATAKFISACNPVAITALLALARQAAEKDTEIARLRKALLPFVRVAEMEVRAASCTSVMINVDRCRDAQAVLRRTRSLTTEKSDAND